MSLPPKLIAIVGSTASGKTDLALRLAEDLHAPILCVDSMQVYRHLDIGTAKPAPEQRRQVRHFGLDLAEPYEPFHAGRFAAYAEPLVQQALQKHEPLVMCGGTGLYFRALLEGFFEAPAADPEVREALKARLNNEGKARLHEELTRRDAATAEGIHPNDGRRIVRALEIMEQTGETVTALRERQPRRDWARQTCFIGIGRSQNDLARRIGQRTGWMYENGLIEETEWLVAQGCSPDWTAMQALGYKECHAFVTGEWTLEQARDETCRGTIRYARRQRTWFRHQADVEWIETPGEASRNEIYRECLNRLKKRGYNTA